MTSRRQHRWKMCRRKRRYRSAGDAGKIAGRVAYKHGKQNVYECPYCGGWHIGHSDEE